MLLSCTWGLGNRQMHVCAFSFHLMKQSIHIKTSTCITFVHLVGLLFFSDPICHLDMLPPWDVNDLTKLWFIPDDYFSRSKFRKVQCSKCSSSLTIFHCRDSSGSVAFLSDGYLMIFYCMEKNTFCLVNISDKKSK